MKPIAQFTVQAQRPSCKGPLWRVVKTWQTNKQTYRQMKNVKNTVPITSARCDFKMSGPICNACTDLYYNASILLHVITLTLMHIDLLHI